MNKRTLFLITIAILLLLILSYRFYTQAKKSALQEQQKLLETKQKMQAIIHLKTKYQHSHSLDAIKPFCKVYTNGSIKVECANLDAKAFHRVQKILLQHPIKSFVIKKTKKGVDVKMELTQ